MANETFNIKFYFEPEALIRDDEIISPSLKIEFDGDVLTDEFTVIPNNSVELPTWTSVPNSTRSISETEDIYEKYATVEFTTELDDDLDIEHTIKLFPSWDQDYIDSIKQVNEETGFNEDFGVFVRDIELNEISVASLIYDRSEISVPLCLESDYEEDGFIQHYLVPQGLTDKLQIIDGRYWYMSNGDYIHMPGSSMSLTFKTPLYLWLLELLLQ